MIYFCTLVDSHLWLEKKGEAWQACRHCVSVKRQAEPMTGTRTLSVAWNPYKSGKNCQRRSEQKASNVEESQRICQGWIFAKCRDSLHSQSSTLHSSPHLPSSLLTPHLSLLHSFPLEILFFVACILFYFIFCVYFFHIPLSHFLL